MRKIISLFCRNYDGDHLVRNEVVPGAEWVLAGEGVPTIKHDGTCCLVRDGKLFKRFDAKHGKTPPPGFEPAQEPDPKTGHWPGWILVGDGPGDQWHREAFARCQGYSDGTYELIGPKIGGNPEGVSEHILIHHGCQTLHGNPRTFDEIREYLSAGRVEGIVWHHPDGRMVKIKAKDFGIKRAAVAVGV